MSTSTVGTTEIKPVETEVTKSKKQESRDSGRGMFNEMEAVEFIKEFRRYCKAKGTDARYVMMLNSDEEIVRGIMEWSEQNPYKTNLDKLRDVFPDYRESELPCPISVTRDVACGDITRGTSCKVCKKLFWNSEYTEDKK